MSVEELADAMNLSQGAKEHLFPKNIGLLMFSEEPAEFFNGIQIDVVEFPNGLGAKKFNEKTLALWYFPGSIFTKGINLLSVFLSRQNLKNLSSKWGQSKIKNLV